MTCSPVVPRENALRGWRGQGSRQAGASRLSLADRCLLRARRSPIEGGRRGYDPTRSPHQIPSSREQCVREESGRIGIYQCFRTALKGRACVLDDGTVSTLARVTAVPRAASPVL